MPDSPSENEVKINRHLDGSFCHPHDLYTHVPVHTCALTSHIFTYMRKYTTTTTTHTHTREVALWPPHKYADMWIHIELASVEKNAIQVIWCYLGVHLQSKLFLQISRKDSS